MNYRVEVIEECDLPKGVGWIVVRLNGGPPVAYVKRSRIPEWGRQAVMSPAVA